MNIKDVLWKWKRAIRRNRETISRVVSGILIVILLAFFSVTAYQIYRADKEREALANQEIKDDGIVIAPGWDYGEPGFHKVAENDKLILEADYTTAEIRVTDKSSGKEWYSNPPERGKDMMVAIRSRIDSQIHVKFLDLKSRNAYEYDNSAASIKKGGMTHELVENGIKFTFAFPKANVYIPVQYTLTQDSFQAEILTDEIKGVGSNPWAINSITLLPYFGAGGLEDDGYLFVPDGSGALIDFNNGKQRTAIFNSPVYGDNLTLTGGEANTVKERISLPIFGAKCNDGAFLGVIVSGDANSSIYASTSKKTSSYNSVYSSCLYTDYSLILRQAAGGEAGNDTRILDYSENLMQGKNYAIRYFFLNDEDADYTGMSKRYREFLTENNLLKESDLADKKYLVLDLVGAVSIDKYVFGVKRPVITALTTYNDVCTIVKELKEQGVENLIINYIGACEKGMNNVIYDQVNHVSALGSKKEFVNMINYLKQENVQLFLETNTVDLYNNGNGIKENRDSVKSFFNAYAFQYIYKLDSQKPVDETRWHLLHPSLVPKMTTKFAESLSSWNVDNISIARIAEAIYSDYSRDNPHVSRMQALDFWDAALKAASENAKYTMVHGGNVYCSPYADIITDTSDSYSNFDMQDHSVPFYQMVFSGKKLITSYGINTSVDYEKEFMKVLECGTNLKFNLIYGDVAQLVNTPYNTMVSYSYEYWKDIIVEQYHAMQEVAQFAGEDITLHEILDENVVLTVYESGKVVVNNGDKPYYYDGKKVGPRAYLVLTGGAK